jgi:DNA-binding beta-propeller fold protein YncE
MKRPEVCSLRHAAGMLLLGLCCCWPALAGDAPREVTVLEPPGVKLRPTPDGDQPVLVNGRTLSPAGQHVKTLSYSWGLAISPDETTAVLVTAEAVQLFSLNPLRAEQRLEPFFNPTKRKQDDGMYMGCGFSPDSSKLYVGSANRGQIVTYDVRSRKLVGTISIDGDGFEDSFLGAFAVAGDGRRLVAVDQFNYRLVTVDLEAGKVTQSVRMGRNPFNVCLSPDGKFAWVSNVGMFEYPLLPGVNATNQATAGLSFPAYGLPSREAEQGVTIGGVFIPGLGSPNHPDAMSIFKVDLETGRVEAKLKTGYLVGAKRKNINTVGGASPSTVAVGKRFAYVSNATNDNISIIDVTSNQIVAHVELNVPGLEEQRGVLPFGLDLSPDESKLYVACAGLNAVAVVDTKSRKLEGYIPAGWFCAFVRVSRDGRELFIASAKGTGSGRNGGRGFTPPEDRGLHPASIMQGLFQRVAAPDRAQLDTYTRQVIDNTYRARKVVDDGKNPLPPKSGLRASPIKHVVFIVKENRSFDQVFGQREGVNGDPTLANLGRDVTVRNKQLETVSGVNVTPNHQALADRFAISDNFYCDSDQSNTGHRWVVGVYPNEWVEVNAQSRIESRLFSSAPGRRYVNGSSATVMPEDYNEAGALWEHLTRHRIGFFNFGFGTEMPMSLEEQIHKHTGVQMSVSFPLPKPLFDHTSRNFPTFNMNIPDQYRVDVFEQEFRERWASGKEPLPRLITMVLPNDHMAGERPEAGYPFGESYVADNDLALGRVVQSLSHSPFWKDLLIIVTEDDPQGGRDHVDAHRSLLVLIGPSVKRHYVSSELMNFGSLIKLIFTVLDLPYLNQFDGAASLPRDCFAEQPDLEPYNLVRVDERIFDPAKALKPFDHGFDWSSLLKSPKMDDPDDMRAGFEDDDDD